MEHQEGAGDCRKTQPDPAPTPRNRSIAPTGDFLGMGHCDSPAHVSGYGGVRLACGRTAEAASESGCAGLKTGRAAKLNRGIRAAGKWALLLFVRFYQIFLSPFFGGACKFYPSCSRYGYEA